VRIDSPWGGMPIARPVGMSLHRRVATPSASWPTPLVCRLVKRLPGREFVLGAYANLPAMTSPECRGRLPHAPGRRARPPPHRAAGRPRLRGERLTTPPKLAARA
jgi:hypothetical protein